MCVGYWREVGSNIGTSRATWRDRNTWGALKKFGRYLKYDWSRLHWACLKGKEARVLEQLAEFRFGIEMRDKKGWTPLISACIFGKTAVARLLLDRGAAPEARDEYGYTSLYMASLGGFLDVTRQLLDRGASVSATTNIGSSPLCAASQRGDAAVVRELLSRGADVDARDDTDMTPLMWASSLGRLEAAKVLIACGADVNTVDNNNDSALQTAIYNKHADIEALLRAHGAV